MSPEIRRYRRYGPPFLAFAAIWLVAVGLLALRGRWGWVRAATGEAVVLGAFVALTFWLTRDRPPLPEAGSEGVEAPVRESGSQDHAGPAGRSASATLRLAAQLAVAFTMAVLTVVRFQEIPVWSTFIDGLYRLGRALPGAPNCLANPVLYVLVPGALVLALGASWREIGFRRGWRSWRVTAVWSAPVVVAWIYYVASGQAAVGRILGAAVSNLFQNGFGEEFLWRGVIQTRIARLWTPEWGLVLASLAFGFWHIDAIPDWSGGDLWVAAALNVVIQAPMGLALGVIFDRTRNLLAPTIVHVMANTVAV